MLSIVIYSIGCFVAALLLTTFYVFTRPMHQRDDIKSWRIFFTFFILCFGGPYAWVEGLTRIASKPMESALKGAYYDANLHGKVVSYKLLFTNGDHARAFVIGNEGQGWGLTDQPVVTVQLDRTPKGWKATTYDVLWSDRLNKDGLVFPPYW